MVTSTRRAQSEGRAQATAQSNAPLQQDDGHPSSSDDDIPAAATLNYKRVQSMFTGPTLRPIKRVRNSLEYIPSSKRRKVPETTVVAGDEECQPDGDSGEDDDTLLTQQLALEVVNSFRGTKSRDPRRSHTEPQPEPQPVTSGVKRRRGRPRKHPLPVTAQDQPAFETHLSQRALDEVKALAKDTLDIGSAEAQSTQERNQELDSVEVEYHTAHEALGPLEHQESQLLGGANDNADGAEQDEEQQGEESPQKDKRIGATPMPDRPIQESDGDWRQELDSDSDDEFPPLDVVREPTKNQLPASAQPKQDPEHTRPSPILGSDPADEFTDENDDMDQEDDYEESEGDNVRAVIEDEEQPDKENEVDNRLPCISPSRRFTPAKHSLLSRTPESDNNSPRVKIGGNSIMSLRKIMMGPGWTGLGKDWAKTIVQPYRDRVRRPTDTSEIMGLCTQLHQLTILSEQATKQKEYLPRGLVNGICKSIEAIQDIVSVCEQRLSPDGVTEPHQRRLVKQDLFRYGIPMLIVVLSSAYCLGEVDGGDNGIDEGGFPKSGMFTDRTVDHLLRVTDWITRLDTQLAPEVADEEDVEDEHVLKRIRENRQLFKKFLDSWDKTLQQARGKLIEAKFARDEAIKRARQAAHEAELARSEARYAAFALSTQRLRSQPRPLAELWQKATRSSGVVTSVRSEPTHHQQQPGSRVSATSSSQPRVSSTGSTSSAEQPRSNKPYYPTWSDEKKEWLLDQLRKVGPNVLDWEYEDFALDLKKPVMEVRYEAERLRAAARSLAEERGTKVERWARLKGDD